MYSRIEAFNGSGIYEYVLKPWVTENDYTAYIGGFCGNTHVNTTIILPEEESGELYAISRVLDLLTLHFQPENPTLGSGFPCHEISLSDYISFGQSI
jgi:hypothetical protein